VLGRPGSDASLALDERTTDVYPAFVPGRPGTAASGERTKDLSPVGPDHPVIPGTEVDWPTGTQCLAGFLRRLAGFFRV